MRCTCIFANLVTVATLFACDASSDGDALAARLRSCGFLTPGILPVRNDTAECFADCMIDASCDEIATVLCGDEDSALLAQCDETCDDIFTCNVTGSTLSPIFVCDGFDHCPDGEDELDCDFRTCDDDRVLQDWEICNGAVDCVDESDETGCDIFTCDGDLPLPAQFVCDGTAECEDGTDEEGCAQFHAMCEQRESDTTM